MRWDYPPLVINPVFPGLEEIIIIIIINIIIIFIIILSYVFCLTMYFCLKTSQHRVITNDLSY